MRTGRPTGWIAACSPSTCHFDFTSRVRIVAVPRTTVGTPSDFVRAGKVSAKVEGYKETNYCPPDIQALQEVPQCRSYDAGPLQAAITSRDRRAWLGVLRKAGGTQADDCETPDVSLQPGNAQISGMDQPQVGISLPLDLRSRSFYTLGKRKKLIRVLRIDGTCDDATVYHGRRDEDRVPGGDERCTVSGTINVEIKRLR